MKMSIRINIVLMFIMIGAGLTTHDLNATKILVRNNTDKTIRFYWKSWLGGVPGWRAKTKSHDMMIGPKLMNEKNDIWGIDIYKFSIDTITQMANKKEKIKEQSIEGEEYIAGKFGLCGQGVTCPYWIFDISSNPSGDSYHYKAYKTNEATRELIWAASYLVGIPTLGLGTLGMALALDKALRKDSKLIKEGDLKMKK